MMREERARVRSQIASIIDRPSVFMGGPSQNSLRKADQIMDALYAAGRLVEASCQHEQWADYRQHGAYCPTCGRQMVDQE